MARNKYLIGVYGAPGVDFEDKQNVINYHVRRLMNVCAGMLKFTGLPETMPERDIKRLLQNDGFMCVVDPALTGGKMYAFTGGLGGEPNVYYMPTICTVSNPALNFSKSLEIDKDCVIVRHDSYYMGLYPIINYYATLMTETDVSIVTADINARIPAMISAGDDRTFESAKQYLKDIKCGKLGVIMSNEFFEGLKTAPYTGQAQNGLLSNLIELKQYTKASFYNEIGINANYNMKRESLNSAESQLNDDALLPLVDDIIKNVKEGIAKVNEMFGSNIGVELTGVWKDRQIIQENQVTDTENKTEPDEPTNPEGGAEDETV